MNVPSVIADALKYFTPSKRQNPGNRVTQSYLSVMKRIEGLPKWQSVRLQKRSLPMLLVGFSVFRFRATLAYFRAQTGTDA